jgi:hypothetical protein
MECTLAWKGLRSFVTRADGSRVAFDTIAKLRAATMEEARCAST